MSEPLGEPALYLVRHGQTEWSRDRRHTSRTDLPLLPEGRAAARALAGALGGLPFARVLCSPRLRAWETGELAGFGERLEVWDDLREWDYGVYEGLTSVEIRAERPDWWLWRDGCPGGESAEEIGARADRVISVVLDSAGDVLVFAHGHFLRVLAARWCGFGVEAGSRLFLAPATLSKLGHENALRVIEVWNAG